MNSHSRTASNVRRLRQKAFFRRSIRTQVNVKIVNLQFENNNIIGIHNSAGASKGIGDRETFTYKLEEITKYNRKKILTKTFNTPKLIGCVVRITDKWNKHPKLFSIVKKIS